MVLLLFLRHKQVRLCCWQQWGVRHLSVHTRFPQKLSVHVRNWTGECPVIISSPFLAVSFPFLLAVLPSLLLRLLHSPSSNGKNNMMYCKLFSILFSDRHVSSCCCASYSPRPAAPASFFLFLDCFPLKISSRQVSSCRDFLHLPETGFLAPFVPLDRPSFEIRGGLPLFQLPVVLSSSLWRRNQ